jgi:transcriptional regulator with XRE-family HTH domain
MQDTTDTMVAITLAEHDAELGARLRHVREALGLSQRELAARAGLSHTAVQHLESGARQSPGIDTVAALETALGGARLTSRVTAEERGYAEQLACSDVDTETLHALAKVGGLSRIVGKLDELASLAAGLVRAGHESSTAAMSAKALSLELGALAKAVRK